MCLIVLQDWQSILFYLRILTRQTIRSLYKHSTDKSGMLNSKHIASELETRWMKDMLKYQEPLQNNSSSTIKPGVMLRYTLRNKKRTEVIGTSPLRKFTPWQRTLWLIPQTSGQSWITIPAVFVQTNEWIGEWCGRRDSQNFSGISVMDDRDSQWRRKCTRARKTLSKFGTVIFALNVS